MNNLGGSLRNNIFALAMAILFLSGCGSSLIRSRALSEVDPLGGSHHYALPKGIVMVEVTPNWNKTACDKKNKTLIKIEKKIWPDESKRYLLSLNTNSFFGDEIKLENDSSGLLMKVTTKSKDNSLEITNHLLALTTDFAKLTSGSSAASRVWSAGLPGDDSPPETCQTVVIRCAAGEDCLVHKTPLTSLQLKKQGAANPMGTNAQICPDDAICYRPMVPWEVTAKMGEVEFSEWFLLPDHETVIPIRITRAPFVEQSENYTFVDGALTVTDIKRPSSAAGFLQIPVHIVQAIVALPSAVLDFKFTTSTKEKNLATAQLELLQKQAALLAELMKRPAAP